MSGFGVSAVQFGAVPGDAAANRRLIAGAVRAEAEAGAKLIVLPELAVSGYHLDEALLRATAEPAAGETAELLAALAARHEATIVCGFCEDEGGRLYNSALLVTPQGQQVLYRKLHLFDGEKEVFTPGDRGLVLAETPVGTVGICVCYDLRFVEVARGLALMGADLLAVPTAWTGGFDRAPRDEGGFIGQARGAVVQANLNQLPMVCASQSGTGQAIRFLGSSLIADAYGACLAGPMGEDEAGAVRAVLDLDQIRAARRRSDRIRPREDRRVDVYSLGVNGRSY
ncbi:nitrilase-related carbon-nitrogen hydrolase [Pseudogemmobacter humi]|uniref:(R)-stereoselective amidase n=1 Tax=Pseudogemmobacter humi TaxID=2483812 RepID=A0A3P5WTK3_9RHOB|nr:nitrilase-related carbon-nitrogen hydrolase [Pseudogemmobacter humi]VDC24975.1 (R)-stereoselective amidase [Pseudogemmobacter humi]